MNMFNNSFLKPIRLGLPIDVANAIAFLASKDASYITGEILTLAGAAIPRM